MSETESNRRNRRRGSFDQVAALYDAARPTYPSELVADLMELSAAGGAHSILEVGAGTGQLSLPLAKLGLQLTVVELGESLARVLQEKLGLFTRTQVIVADFDEWHMPVESFDLIVVATAFHWLDPDKRVQKCVNLLKPGGVLAIIETRWGAGGDDDEFASASQSCYARWDAGHDPSYRKPALAELPQRHEELENSKLFASILHRRYIRARCYSADAYRDLAGTFSDVLALEPRQREGFLNCIHTLIEKRFGGSVMRHDVYDLWLARKG